MFLSPIFRSRILTETEYEDLVANTQVLQDTGCVFSCDNFAFSTYV